MNDLPSGLWMEVLLRRVENIEVYIVSYHRSHRLAQIDESRETCDVWLFDLCACVSHHKYHFILDKLSWLARQRPGIGSRQTWQSKLNMSSADSSGSQAPAEVWHQRRNCPSMSYVTQNQVSVSQAKIDIWLLPSDTTSLLTWGYQVGRTVSPPLP